MNVDFIQMLTLTFEEFINKFNIDNKAMSNIEIECIVKNISLTPIEIVMRDQTPVNINDSNFNIIGNLHPIDGSSTHWVLDIRRRGGKVYYFDSFGVKTAPLFLKEYIDLGSDKRIQEYNESYCGAYFLYMIYVFDNGYRIKSALIAQVNQVKSPQLYKKCLGCKAKGKVEVNDVDNDNQRSCFTDQGTCFADVNDKDIVNGNVKGNVDDNVNQGTCFADVTDKDIVNGNVNGNVDDNVNQGTCIADVNDNVDDETGTKSHNNDKLKPSLSDDTYSDSDDTVWSESHKYINIFSKTKQKDKRCSKCGRGRGNNVGVRTSGLGSPSNLLIDVNDSLQSWINKKQYNR